MPNLSTSPSTGCAVPDFAAVEQYCLPWFFRVIFVSFSWPTAVFRLNRRFVFNQAALFAATRIAILAQLADQDGNLLEL